MWVKNKKDGRFKKKKKVNGLGPEGLYSRSLGSGSLRHRLTGPGTPGHGPPRWGGSRDHDTWRFLWGFRGRRTWEIYGRAPAPLKSAELPRTWLDTGSGDSSHVYSPAKLARRPERLSMRGPCVRRARLPSSRQGEGAEVVGVFPRRLSGVVCGFGL